MTQEQKAKAYDEAVNKLKGFMAQGVDPLITRADVQDFFPELKESEDEKVRKEIQSVIEQLDKDTTICGKKYDYNQWLTWLEKQGESYTKRDVDDAFVEGMAFAKNELEKQGEQKETLCDRCRKEQPSHSCQDITALGRCAVEHEQKPADKVKPKFHEGDWVVSKLGNVWHIDSFDNKNYKVTDINGNHNCFPIYIQDRIHLWTIQDAKDGDVLVCPLPKSLEYEEQIFIFKGINSRDYVDNCIEYYCRVYQGVFYENENGYMGTTSSPLYPATKEQRDTLLKAMTDAGWEFDFEKKELKKIDDNEVKGRADVLRNIDPDEMVADFCSQPLSKTRSLASIYRQGIKDLLKKINNNEKTSITGTRSIDDGGVHRA